MHRPQENFIDQKHRMSHQIPFSITVFTIIDQWLNCLIVGNYHERQASNYYSILFSKVLKVSVKVLQLLLYG